MKTVKAFYRHEYIKISPDGSVTMFLFDEDGNTIGSVPAKLSHDIVVCLDQEVSVDVSDESYAEILANSLKYR